MKARAAERGWEVGKPFEKEKVRIQKEAGGCMFSFGVCFVKESLVCFLVGAVVAGLWRATVSCDAWAFEYWRPVGFAGFLCMCWGSNNMAFPHTNVSERGRRREAWKASAKGFGVALSLSNGEGLHL